MHSQVDAAILDSKPRLVALIINQKRIGEAATSAQRVFREHSSRRSSVGSRDEHLGSGRDAAAELAGPPVDLA